ncbi:MAG: HD family phosphohydrolase [Candidatus Nitrospinota bacterium M3_3B_026]
MTPAGKIINIDAFKKKESGLAPSRKRPGDDGDAERRRKEFVFLLLLSVALALALMMTPSRTETIKVPEEGSIAPGNIKAPEDMLIEDNESTAKKKREAREAVLDVYDFDSQAEKKIKAKINEAFFTISSVYSTRAGMRAYKDVISVFDADEAVSPPPGDGSLAESRAAVNEFENSEAFKAAEKEFWDKLGVEPAEKALKSARYYHYSPRIGEMVSSIISPIYATGLVTSKGQLPPTSARGITLRRLSTGASREVKDFQEIYDLAEAERRIRKEAGVMISDNRPGLRRLVTHMAEGLVQPNITFNKKETELRKDKAEAETKPVFFRVQRGEMIVREGERVTPAHVAKLEHIAGMEKDRGRMEVFFGFLALTLLLVTLSSIFVNKFHEDIRGHPRLQLLLAMLLVGHMGLIWVFTQVFTVFAPQAAGLGIETYILAAPLAFGPMMVSIFFNTELTVLFTIVAAALTGLYFRDFSMPSLITMTGGMICAYQVRMYSKRSSVMKVGAYVSVVNAVAVAAFAMAGGEPLSDRLVSSMVLAAMGGALTVLFVSGALPLVEGLFPVVTDIKLLEIVNQDHPLLRRMIMEAPGTYQHSMMVGVLAEEACKAIGANALLAKAGAMFHDIGKLKKPEYFSENQTHGKNPHDKLTPSMSTLIVVNHVKEGLEMARQYKLLPQIAAMIPEHHGTQLASFFYEKAKRAEDTTRGTVKEGDFRYPGPAPGSKESACVALADNIEARARACKDPTPLMIKTLVKEAINDKFEQGQLDNSHLTLKDLAMMEDSFVRVLSAIHHHRIEYPGAKEGERRGGHGGEHTQEEKDEKTRRGAPAEEGGADPVFPGS